MYHLAFIHLVKFLIETTLWSVFARHGLALLVRSNILNFISGQRQIPVFKMSWIKSKKFVILKYGSVTNMRHRKHELQNLHLYTWEYAVF
jgi:hypothetical protein